MASVEVGFILSAIAATPTASLLLANQITVLACRPQSLLFLGGHRYGNFIFKKKLLVAYKIDFLFVFSLYTMPGYTFKVRQLNLLLFFKMLYYYSLRGDARKFFNGQQNWS
jgi:hypothetical protein